MSAQCREVLKARWCEPTLSVVDVRIGDEDGSGDSAYRFGPTRFSVIPRSAVGNVSIRFVPDQNADHLIAALRCVFHMTSTYAKHHILERTLFSCLLKKCLACIPWLCLCQLTMLRMKELQITGIA